MDPGQGVKGSLRNSNHPIMKAQIRNNDGTPAHKSEFRLNDKSSIVSFLILLRDKFGVTCFDIKKEFVSESKSIINDEKRHLDEWREKTKGLRNDDPDLKEKMKRAFS